MKKPLKHHQEPAFNKRRGLAISVATKEVENERKEEDKGADDAEGKEGRGDKKSSDAGDEGESGRSM